jgi:hypothetical protein
LTTKHPEYLDHSQANDYPLTATSFDKLCIITDHPTNKYNITSKQAIMSADAAAEPGVPVDVEPSYIPPAGEKSVAKEVEKRAPSGLLDVLSKPDRIILRLNKYVEIIPKSNQIEIPH